MGQGVGVRVGLNAGEPLARGDDLFGTTVQLAFRIADHATAGEVLVSNVVRELCAGKQLDEVTFKGFEEPLAVYAALER